MTPCHSWKSRIAWPLQSGSRRFTLICFPSVIIAEMTMVLSKLTISVNNNSLCKPIGTIFTLSLAIKDHESS